MRRCFVFRKAYVREYRSTVTTRDKRQRTDSRKKRRGFTAQRAQMCSSLYLLFLSPPLSCSPFRMIARFMYLYGAPDGLFRHPPPPFNPPFPPAIAPNNIHFEVCAATPGSSPRLPPRSSVPSNFPRSSGVQPFGNFSTGSKGDQLFNRKRQMRFSSVYALHLIFIDVTTDARSIGGRGLKQ